MRNVSHQRPGRAVPPSRGARLALSVAAAANPSVSQRIHEWMVKTTAYIPPIICDGVRDRACLAEAQVISTERRRVTLGRDGDVFYRSNARECGRALGRDAHCARRDV